MATYDVFLSYSSPDREVVETIAKRLRDEQDLKVFFDRWILVPGTQWQSALEEALAESRTYAVFIGPKGLGPWHNAEMRAALGQRMEEEPKRVIPVLLPGSEASSIPQFLGQRTWVDLRSGLDNDSALHRLVAGIRGISPLRDPRDSDAETRGSGPVAPKNKTSELPWWRRLRAADWGLLIGGLAIVLAGLVWAWPRDSAPSEPPSVSPPVSTPAPAEKPDLYAVRVQILDPDGRPVDGAVVRVSTGNEPQLLPDGWWQIEVPAAKAPKDGKITLWAEHPQWNTTKSNLLLAADPNPRVEIRLQVPEEKITGVIADARGRGVQGARVTARNFSATATVTDQDGRFELSVEAARDQNVRLHVEHPDFPPKDSFCLAGSDGCAVVLVSQ